MVVMVIVYVQGVLSVVHGSIIDHHDKQNKYKHVNYISSRVECSLETKSPNRVECSMGNVLVTCCAFCKSPSMKILESSMPPTRIMHFY